MLLKQHLDMIGRNEPIQRKARFWQSYVRALKDDPTYLAEDAWDAHDRRMESIDELLPLKYRYPQYYRPGRASSVPPVPRSSSVPPTTLRAMSRARSVTPAPPHIRDMIHEEEAPRKPIYTYTGNILLDDDTLANYDPALPTRSRSDPRGAAVRGYDQTFVRRVISPYCSSNFFSYAGDVVSSHLTNYLVYKHLHFYNPGSSLWNMRHDISSDLDHRQTSQTQKLTSRTVRKEISSKSSDVYQKQTNVVQRRSSLVESAIAHKQSSLQESDIAHDQTYSQTRDRPIHRNRRHYPRSFLSSVYGLTRYEP